MMCDSFLMVKHEMTERLPSCTMNKCVLQRQEKEDIKEEKRHQSQVKQDLQAGPQPTYEYIWITTSRSRSAHANGATERIYERAHACTSPSGEDVWSK